MLINVANDTKQNVDFHYRLPVEGKLRGSSILEIPSGRQVDVGHGWSPEQRKSFIEQLEHFGARDAAEVHGTMGKHTGLIYRVGGVIEEDEILHGNEAVTTMAQKRSAAVATRGALAFDLAANQSQGRRGGKRLAKATEVSVEELAEPGSRSGPDAVMFRVGVAEDGSEKISIPD